VTAIASFMRDKFASIFGERIIARANLEELISVSVVRKVCFFFSVYQNWMYVCGIMCLRQFRGAYFGHAHFFGFVLQHDLPWFVCVVACVGEWVRRWVGGVGGWFGCIVWAFPFAVLIIENCARTLTHTRTHKHTRIQVLACICI